MVFLALDETDVHGALFTGLAASIAPVPRVVTRAMLPSDEELADEERLKQAHLQAGDE